MYKRFVYWTVRVANILFALIMAGGIAAWLWQVLGVDWSVAIALALPVGAVLLIAHDRLLLVLHISTDVYIEHVRRGGGTKKRWFLTAVGLDCVVMYAVEKLLQIGGTGFGWEQILAAGGVAFAAILMTLYYVVLTRSQSRGF